MLSNLRQAKNLCKRLQEECDSEREYQYVFVCVYMCIYVRMCACVYVHACTVYSIYLCICMSVVHTCMCMCVRICRYMCVCMCVCMYVCMCMYRITGFYNVYIFKQYSDTKFSERREFAKINYSLII